MKKCVKCNKELCSERAELFGTCIECTPQFRNLALMGMCNKTGLHVAAIVRNEESLRLASLSSPCVIRRKGIG